MGFPDRPTPKTIAMIPAFLGTAPDDLRQQARVVAGDEIGSRPAKALGLDRAVGMRCHDQKPSGM